jgi:DNA-binding transcriptional LysR family regulator
VVAVLSTGHPQAGEEAISLAALADEFLLFPRELAPRLHDYYVNLCRRAGFEPRQGGDSSRTRWTIGTWDASTTALFPQSVAKDLPDGLVAVPIDEPPGILETYVLWRAVDQRPTVEAFVEVSSAVFTPAAV